MNATVPIPAHVPPHLVFDFDMWKMGAGMTHPHEHWKTIRAAGAPPVFYTPRHGGHWIAHTFDAVYEGFRESVRFTTYPNGIPARKGGAEKLIPVEIDPPEHAMYRRALTPLFTPAAVRRVEVQIRERMIELIESFRAKGRCDFAEDVSLKLPTAIFCALMGMPMEKLPEILEREHQFLRGPDEASREQGANDILTYMIGFLAEKEKAPADDMATLLLGARNDAGEPWSKAEIYNAAFLLYVAGLDTVANMMSFMWYRLATEPETRRHVAAHVDHVNDFVDELMRVSGPAVHVRRAKEDCEFQGVFLKAADAVLLVPALANRDPKMFPDPERVDWTRRNAREHVGFGAGPHRCIGAHLARFEIVIALEEWFRRIPDFTLAPDNATSTYVGNITGFSALPLTWKP